MKRAALEIKGLSAWYGKKGAKVLKDLNLSLEEGKVTGLIGVNGAGKTTLIKSVSGLLKTCSVEEVRYEGVPVAFRDERFKRERYVVFAEDRSFRYFTFREYLDYVSKAYEKDTANVSELISGFRFEEYENKLIKDLSTGNLKKVYLITAFALRPKLLILDEPVNGLDIQSTEFLYELIQKYKEYGTLLFSSHILESMCLTSDKILVLDNGSISTVFEGEDIKSDVIRRELKRYDVQSTQ